MPARPSPLFLRRRRGTETIEFIATLAVMLMVMTAVISLFVAFANALVAQHALSQTAIYVAANGRYTVGAQERCVDLMPGGGSGAGQVTCRLLRPDGSEIAPAANASQALPAAFGTPLTIRVEYQQPWFFLCPAGAGCDRLTSSISREIDVLSLTQQRPRG